MFFVFLVSKVTMVLQICVVFWNQHVKLQLMQRSNTKTYAYFGRKQAKKETFVNILIYDRAQVMKRLILILFLQ